MTRLWSPVIVAGLFILVYLMIAGVPFVRDERDSVHGSTPRTFLPMAGAFLTTAGIAGYLLWKAGRPAVASRIFLVVAVALIAAVAARWIVRTSFATPSKDPEDDPHYRWQGHVARLTRPITFVDPGRVAFQFDGREFDFAAISIDGEPIAADTEVVIERVDDTLATVERWTAVEERL